LSALYIVKITHSESNFVIFESPPKSLRHYILFFISIVEFETDISQYSKSAYWLFFMEGMGLKMIGFAWDVQLSIFLEKNMPNIFFNNLLLVN
jgi:hypothetical protein